MDLRDALGQTATIFGLLAFVGCVVGGIGYAEGRQRTRRAFILILIFGGLFAVLMLGFALAAIWTGVKLA